VLENKEIEGPSLSIVTIEGGLDPWTLYLYAMKSPATKEKYLMRLGKFLNFLNIQEGETEQEQHPSLSTQAYRLFSESKTPLEVAIELNLSQRQQNSVESIGS
jgi:hypothetical protein